MHAADETPAHDVIPWSLGRRFAFRVLAIYTLLWILPFPLPVWIPEALFGVQIGGLLSDAVVPWFGREVLGVAGTYETWAASGDTAYRLVFHLLILIVALVGAGLWSALDRRAIAHRRAFAWLTVLMRFQLAGAMLGYGFDKVAGTQFGWHRPARLYTTFGDLTPTELLWAFMGHSQAYSAFTGLAEVIGGLLLFSRRTTTLGALLLVAVMSNVVLLNITFDVPVKLYSSHLLASAIFLAALDARPLVDLFLRGRSAALRVLPPPTQTAKGARVWKIARALLIAELLLWPVADKFGPRIYFHFRPMTRHPLEGSYEVETYVREGREVPPRFDERARWRTLFIGPDGRIQVLLADGHAETFWTTPIDRETNTASVRRLVDDTTKEFTAVGELKVVADGERVSVDGELDGASLHAELRAAERRFELTEHRIQLRQGG